MKRCTEPCKPGVIPPLYIDFVDGTITQGPEAQAMIAAGRAARARQASMVDRARAAGSPNERAIPFNSHETR